MALGMKLDFSLEERRRRRLGEKIRRKRHKQADRGSDLYETHEVAPQALLAHERLPHMIWEASCGPGRLARVLRRAGHEVIATDLHDHNSPDQDASGFDFLQQTDVPVQGIDATVQNPPFSKAALFAKKAIELCPLNYLLLPLSFLEAGNDKSAAGRARLEVLDTEYLARVLVFRNRLPMMHRDGWEGPKSTSTVAYAWFIFSWYHRGPALVDRITWEWEPWMAPVKT
jgi:hypothetical protein